MRRILPIYPILFSLYPPLFLFSQNMHRFRMTMVFIPVLCILVSLVFLWTLFRFLLKNNEKAALFLAIHLVLFFIYGYVGMVIKNIHFTIGDLHFGYNKLLIIVWVPFIIGSFFLIERFKGTLTQITNGLNVVSGVLLLFPVIQILFTGVTYSRPVMQSGNEEMQMLIKNYREIEGKKPLPDLYYIIMDSYAREDVLKDAYNYDNRNFINFLTQKGFYIAKNSYSNYNTTDQSLASSLNFEYIDGVIAQMPEDSKNRRPLIELRANAKIIRFLKEIGYSYIYLSNGYESIEPKYATYFLSPGWSFGGRFLDEYQNGLLNMTPVHHIVRLFNTDATNYYAQYRKRILFCFDYLSKAYKQKGPKFIFAHIMIPHDPIVFGPNGEELDGVLPYGLLVKKDQQEAIAKYLDELQFGNKKLRFVIERIQAHSDPPPIILLQADHGTFIYESDEEIPLKEFIHHKHAILNAYYFPDTSYNNLYPDITPVNSFRKVLNRYFNAQLRCLDDRIYYSKWEMPYKVVDVTDSLLVVE